MVKIIKKMKKKVSKIFGKCSGCGKKHKGTGNICPKCWRIAFG